VTSNVRSFNLAVEQANKTLVEAQLVRFHRQLAQIAIRRIVLRTPVDTGRTRGNWQAANDSPPGGVIERLDKTGSAAINAAQGSVGAIQPFSVWWFSNNVPHILVLENGGFRPPDPGPSSDRRPDRRGQILVRGGFSVQAPRGMVGVTLKELEQALIASLN
jgi:hypothetical protein